MLQNIPTHVLAGPLGAGKTSLIHHLLAQKPAHERWAILINEFGLIGLDAALLSRSDDGISFSEVAGGCLCCVNGAPFQVGLGRLLRKARPDRLFIEPSGLGHPDQLLEQLQAPPWEGVLSVQPAVMVLDAAAMAAGGVLAETQRVALATAGLLVLNKSEGLDDRARKQLLTSLPSRPHVWTSQGALALRQLPGFADGAPVDKTAVDKLTLPRTLAQLPAVWPDPSQPICLSQDQPEGWSIGWRWHPGQQFELFKVQQWLADFAWRRAKLVIHSNAGWLSGNALDGQAIHWQNSEWRKDSRLELIFSEPQDVQLLQESLAACCL